MALKATVFKAQLQIADMDRSVYADPAVTLARHPSETDERMMVRLVAFALNVPADDRGGTLDFAKGLWDPDEPELWHRDLTGAIVHWIDVGQPDERRLLKASGRAAHVSVYSYSPSTSIWWSGVANRIARARNVQVWQVPSAASQALADMTRRSLQLQVTRQDGTVWVADGERSVEVDLVRLSS